MYTIAGAAAVHNICRQLYEWITTCIACTCIIIIIGCSHFKLSLFILGDTLCFGSRLYFRFNNPQEAKKLRELPSVLKELHVHMKLLYCIDLCSCMYILGILNILIHYINIMYDIHTIYIILFRIITNRIPLMGQLYGGMCVYRHW